MVIPLIAHSYNNEVRFDSCLVVKCGGVVTLEVKLSEVEAVSRDFPAISALSH